MASQYSPSYWHLVKDEFRNTVNFCLSWNSNNQHTQIAKMFSCHILYSIFMKRQVGKMLLSEFLFQNRNLHMPWGQQVQCTFSHFPYSYRVKTVQSQINPIIPGQHLLCIYSYRKQVYIAPQVPGIQQTCNIILCKAFRECVWVTNFMKKIEKRLGKQLGA